MNHTVYQQNGYRDRSHYLVSMAEEYCISPFAVQAIADIYGPDEDFDCLVCALEDYHEFGEMYFGDI